MNTIEVGIILDKNGDISQVQYDPNDTSVKIDGIITISPEEMHFLQNANLEKALSIIGKISKRVKDTMLFKNGVVFDFGKKQDPHYSGQIGSIENGTIATSRASI